MLSIFFSSYHIVIKRYFGIDMIIFEIKNNTYELVYNLYFNNLENLLLTLNKILKLSKKDKSIIKQEIVRRW